MTHDTNNTTHKLGHVICVMCNVNGMRLTLKQLRALRVETVSGTSLGHVHELVFEIEGQMIVQYLVRSSLLSNKEYLISRDQVVRFEEKRMIVDDAVRPIEIESERKKLQVAPKAVAMRNHSPEV